MKIVKPNAEYLEVCNLTSYQVIEKVGRICYKSEDRIKPGSDAKFVKMLADRKHYAMLEHGIVHLEIAGGIFEDMLEEIVRKKSTKRLKYIHYHETKRKSMLVTGSLRAFVEFLDWAIPNNIVESSTLSTKLAQAFPEVFPLSYNLNTQGYRFVNDEVVKKVLPFEHLKHHLFHTVIFTCDRGVTHEFVRHRDSSFAQESTRYCNYSLGKFDNEITVIEPCFWNKHSAQYGSWEIACRQTEKAYFELLDNGATPQEARTVLPNSTKAELVITCNETEWQHIIDLRHTGTTGAPHPQMKEIMNIAVPQLLVQSELRLEV